jgi:hypothetical protein
MTAVPEWGVEPGSIEDYRRGLRIAIDREFSRDIDRLAAASAQRNVYTPDKPGWKAGYEAIKAGISREYAPSRHTHVYDAWQDGYTWGQNEIADAISARNTRSYATIKCKCGCNG